jgi:hypothetical protein
MLFMLVKLELISMLQCFNQFVKDVGDIKLYLQFFDVFCIIILIGLSF